MHSKTGALFLRFSIIPIQEQDEIVNDHFESGVSQTQTRRGRTARAPQADDVDEEDRLGKMKVGLYF